MLSPGERGALIRRIVDEALGLGVLEPLLADETVTEIMVNGPDDIYIERAGRIHRIETTFASEDQLYQTIDRIVSQVNRRVDESSPMVDARLPTGERVNVIIPPLSLVGPVLTIRRFPRAYSIEELVRAKSLDEHSAVLLASFIRARLNVVISGGTGTGKTTMLNALSAFVPERGAHRHDRGLRRAPAQPGAHHPAGEPPAQHRGRGPGRHPRPGPQLTAYAARPHHRR